jgi:hypothetical protein
LEVISIKDVVFSVAGAVAVIMLSSAVDVVSLH